MDVGIDTYFTREPNQPWIAAYSLIEERMTHKAFGLTPLIAAMRCYVASKLGEEVEIPKELT